MNHSTFFFFYCWFLSLLRYTSLLPITAPIRSLCPELLLHPYKQDHGRMKWDMFFQHKSLPTPKNFQKRRKEWQCQAELSVSLCFVLPHPILSPQPGGVGPLWLCLHPVSIMTKHLQRSNPDTLPCAADLWLTQSPPMTQPQMTP